MAMEHLALLFCSLFLGFNLGVLFVALFRASGEEETHRPAPARASELGLVRR
jgi:hypothetical protein